MSAYITYCRLLHEPELSLAARPHPDHLSVHQLRGQPDPAQLPGNHQPIRAQHFTCPPITGERHLAAAQQARLHHQGEPGPSRYPNAGVNENYIFDQFFHESLPFMSTSQSMCAQSWSHVEALGTLRSPKRNSTALVLMPIPSDHSLYVYIEQLISAGHH